MVRFWKRKPKEDSAQDRREYMHVLNRERQIREDRASLAGKLKGIGARVRARIQRWKRPIRPNMYALAFGAQQLGQPNFRTTWSRWDDARHDALAKSWTSRR